MNLFQLVIKQMRQRALSTWLTLLSVLLGVALAVAIMILRREAGGIFGQTSYGYDVLVGPKGSPTQLVLNTVYHIDQSPGNIPYSVYEQLLTQQRPFVRIAVPVQVGDSYKGQRIVATSPKMFGFNEDGQTLEAQQTLEYRPGKRYEIAQGRVFHARRFEAVIGSDITRITGLKLGDKFQATHGLPSANQTPDIHEEQWTVVGVLAPTHTSADRVLFVSLTSIYTIAEHEKASAIQLKLREGKDLRDAQKEVEQELEARHRVQPATSTPATTAASAHDHDHDEHAHDDHAHDEHDHAATSPSTTQVAADEHEHHDHDHGEKPYTLNDDGTINLKAPKSEWQLSAVLVKSRSDALSPQLMYALKFAGVVEAVNPASVMRQFFEMFLKPSTAAWQAVSFLVIVVAAVGILVSIYNSVSARMRDIAILRALGATRLRILALICLEAGLVGLIGALGGLVAGHALAGVGAVYLERMIGESIRWMRVSPEEIWFVVGVVVLSVLAGLVPALKAYRTPVATNLVAG